MWRGWAALAFVAACGRSPVLLEGDEGFGAGSHFDGGDDPHDDGHDGRHEQLCREVDFLFVIDDSATMAQYQTQVVENHHVFIDGIRDAISSIETMHIGVVTTERYTANVVDCEQPGGLLVHTDPGGGVQECGPYKDGHNYMTARDNLEIDLRCALEVGTDGTDLDAPLGAALAAISPPLSDPGACNEGFFTPGALLVLVIVSDSYPSEHPADLDPYFASVSIAERVGSYDDVVVVLFASTEESPCLNPLLPALGDFAGTFPHSFVGAICEHDYSGPFDEAVEVVKGACPH